MSSLLMCTHTTHKQIMQCRIANPAHLETGRLLTTTVHLGNQVQTVGTIRINEPLNLLVILIPVFAGVIILIVAIFIVTLVFVQKISQNVAINSFFCNAEFGPVVGEPCAYCMCLMYAYHLNQERVRTGS